MLRLACFLVLVFGVEGALLPFFSQIVVSIDKQPIRGIVASQQGFLYYFTRLGIYRYDGVEHQVVVQKPLVTSFIEAPTGLLFFSTRDSLFYVDSTGAVAPIELEGKRVGPIYDVVRWRDNLVFITDDALIRVPFREPTKAMTVLLPRIHSGYAVVQDQFYINIIGIGLHVLDEKGAPLALVNGEHYERTSVMAFFSGGEPNKIHILQMDGSIHQFPDQKLIKKIPINFQKELFLNYYELGDTILLLTEKFLYFLSRNYSVQRKIPVKSNGLYFIKNKFFSLVFEEKMYIFSVGTSGFTLMNFPLQPNKVHFLQVKWSKCYIGTDNGLYSIHLANGKWQKQFPNHYITAIQFQKNQIFISSNRGIYEVGIQGKEKRIFTLPTLQFWISQDTLVVELIDGVYVFTPVPPKGPPYQPIRLEPSKLAYYEGKIAHVQFFPDFEVEKEGYLIVEDSIVILYQPQMETFSWISLKEMENLVQPYWYWNGKEWVIRNIVLGSFLRVENKGKTKDIDSQNQTDNRSMIQVSLASVRKEMKIPQKMEKSSPTKEKFSMKYLFYSFLIGFGLGMLALYLYIRLRTKKRL